MENDDGHAMLGVPGIAKEIMLDDILQARDSIAVGDADPVAIGEESGDEGGSKSVSKGKSKRGSKRGSRGGNNGGNKGGAIMATTRTTIAPRKTNTFKPIIKNTIAMQ